MSKTYRPYSPTQSLLLPQSPLEWLPEGHLAFFILDVVAELDLSPIHAHYERELRGKPPHDPQMMLALLFYGYCVGVPSSRKIERKTHEDVAFRVLSAGQHPDHTRISEFRRIHGPVLNGLFLEVLTISMRAGLASLGHLVLDGTKEKANASKHKAMSYGRMKEKELLLKQKVKDLLCAAEEADQAEDAKYGKERRGEELPEDLRIAKTRLAKIRKLRAELEAEAVEQEKERASKGDGDEPPSGPSADLPEHQIPTENDGSPTRKAQRNFTDPESRIQKTGDGFIQGFNAQIVVDEDTQIIVAQAVTNQPPDVEHLAPLLLQAIGNCGAPPEKFTADAGYFSEANVAFCEGLGVDPYIATGRTKEDGPSECPQGRPPGGQTLKQQMDRKLRTKAGKAVYAKRKQVVEPVFGQVKGARGFRQFLRRGLVKVREEWALICLTHNLLKIHRWAAG